MCFKFFTIHYELKLGLRRKIKQYSLNYAGSCLLGVLRECLCMISGHDVWVMKEYGNKESLTKLFTVS
jgi:hypothetical protein